MLGCLALGLLWSLQIPCLRSQPPQDGVAVTRVVSLEYPWLANLSGVQGIVELSGSVSESGDMQDVQTIKGHPLLVAAAKDMLSKWHFAKCASPLSCKVNFTISFELGKTCDRPRCPTNFQVDLPDKIVVSTRQAPAIVN